ncbi:phage tail assembly protein [Candidatus Vondammii sp. HM_W22]|uniref:phage tail assembly protein n=1 Tax=Candidatus Vondammii sp. HM_W22 TaxID=2687299 RepID=UPI001F13D105|nr:phage tail assembly protein [Candidatus Vondammii sp. HM_W22]
MSGELRGIKLLDIMQMDVSAYVPLLPRITTPMLSESQINNLDPADLIQVMTGVQSFFVSADSPAM